MTQTVACPIGRPAVARRRSSSSACTRPSPSSRPASSGGGLGIGRQLADPQCWEELVARLDAPLRRRVTRALWVAFGGPPFDDERVDDLVQEVYCRLFSDGGRRLRLYRGSSDQQLEAFLGRTAERVVADELRRGRAWKRRVRAEAPAPPLGALFHCADARNPEERLLGKERRRLVLATLSQALPAATGRRDAWILRQVLVEGWNSREVSRSLGGRLAPSSVDSLVSRLRRRLAAGAGIELPRRISRRPPRGGARRWQDFRVRCAAV